MSLSSRCVYTRAQYSRHKDLLVVVYAPTDPGQHIWHDSNANLRFPGSLLSIEVPPEVLYLSEPTQGQGAWFDEYVQAEYMVM